ncbi:MAG TPA: hypothetical protein VMY37_15310 [Thermoguttaceae bacterium]|nr:hypothetical protein [Thermoguttaceae bacterium]
MQIARGKAVFFVLVALVTLLEVGPALMGVHGSLFVRVALTIGLWYAMWRGQEWAIAVAAVIYALGAIITLAFGLSSGHLFGFALGGLCATGYAVVVVCLFVSESLNEFFRHQRGALNGTGAVTPTLDIQAAAGELDSAERELVVIYAARTATDAHQLKNLLIEAGIQATVTNTVLEGGSGVDIIGWPTLARVAVAKKDAETARQMALEFDQRIAAMSLAPKDEMPEGESPPSVPEKWHLCPQCGARRTTRCPICGTTGTEFAQADPEFVGTPGLSEDAQPISSCGCGSGGCSHGQSAVNVENGLTGAAGAEAHERREAESDAPEVMLVCTTCDEPFVPEYSRRCPACDHEFPDGDDVESDPAARDRMGVRAVAVILGLAVLFIAVFVYFASLF